MAILRLFVCFAAALALVDAGRWVPSAPFGLSALQVSGPVTVDSSNATGTLAETKHPASHFDWALAKKPEVFKTAAALLLCGVLVSAAGVGGGGMYLAVLMVMGGVSPRDAVPLSHAIVLIGAFAALLVNVRSWVSSGKCDIDLDACRMVVPASLLGTLLGFFMNSFVPDTLILKLLVGVLTLLVAVVMRIWWCQRRDESAVQYLTSPDSRASPQGDNAPSMNSGKSIAIKGDSITRPELIISIALLVVVDVCSVLRFHMLACRDDKSHFNLKGSCTHPVLQVFGQQMTQWLDNVTLANQLKFAVEFVPFLLCMALATYYAQFMYSQKNWSVSRVVTFQGMAWATGVISGLVGIGGGLIFSPFFLITMDPLVAVGTSTTCLLFTALSSTVQYALTDRIIMSLAFTYGVATFCAGILGTIVIRMVRTRLPAGKSHITMIVATAVILTEGLILGKLFLTEGFPRLG